MDKRDIQDALILWQAYDSGITDLTLQAFATRLLRDLDPELGGTRVTMTEYSKRIGVSVPTIWKHAHNLKASGEWEINLVKGQPTTYKPLFMEQALEKFSRS
jgi:hypothetical protein